MWGVIGSWPFLVLVAMLGVVLPLVAWLSSGRSVRVGIATVVLIAIGWLGAVFVMNLPLTVNGAVCNNTATPAGVHAIPYDAQTEAELRGEGIDASRFSCRDELRSRYLLIGAGYGVWTVVGSMLIARRTSRAETRG